ncbi:bacteriohemerythrin [Bacteroides sedimenti]|uniref:Hemerythrin n=1 Tax=Bacteroides sedimenti TaxID=2136147 RepID=A0ABM8I723_9BACE
MDFSATKRNRIAYKLFDIPVIDNQHKHFFEIFDNLILINQKENEDERESDILAELNELQRYAIYHFNTEEQLMQEANWKYVEQHIMQHMVFKNKCLEFQVAYNYRNKVLLEQMVLFLRKWFIMHISEVDAAYADTVKKYFLEKKE